MHDFGIVFPGEDVSSTAHVTRKLVYLIKASIYCLCRRCKLPQITDHKMVCFRPAKTGIFYVDPPCPKSFLFKALNKMAADEATCTANQSGLHSIPPFVRP